MDEDRRNGCQHQWGVLSVFVDHKEQNIEGDFRAQICCSRDFKFSTRPQYYLYEYLKERPLASYLF